MAQGQTLPAARTFPPSGAVTPKLPKVADAHELLQQAEDAWAAKQNELINNGGLTTGGAEQHAVGAHGGGDAFDRAAAWASERRTQTAPLGVTRRDYRRQPEQSQARPVRRCSATPRLVALCIPRCGEADAC